MDNNMNNVDVTNSRSNIMADNTQSMNNSLSGNGNNLKQKLVALNDMISQLGQEMDYYKKDV